MIRPTKHILFRMRIGGQIVPNGLESVLKRNAPHTYKLLIIDEAIDKWKECYEEITGSPPIPPYPDTERILKWYDDTFEKPPKTKIDLTNESVRRNILGLFVGKCSRCKAHMDMCGCCKDHKVSYLSSCCTTKKPSLDDYDQNPYENTSEYWDMMFEIKLRRIPYQPHWSER